ncbi:MAG: hypothetical protein KKG47_02325 [Proteobacteria bacterium]|nr:hypothetical protein [Pseudomonadota bacterium]MBU1737415.1 hypothetical protein [Pseudomonadota bacterium]
MNSFGILLFLGFFFGTGYAALRFFSKLAGVNMTSAMIWGFKAKRFELVLNWGMFYLIAFVMTFALLQKPFMLLTMNVSHRGALLGYAINDETANLYDPLQDEYLSFRVLPSPPPAAERFDETFDVVALYRPFLSDYYQNIELQNIYLALFFMFLSALGLSLMYLIMYTLARAYSSEMKLKRDISHRIVLARFREVTGYRFSRVANSFVLIIILSSFIGGFMVNRITRGYEKEFLPAQEYFRSKIMETVAPEKVLLGRVIRRMFGHKKIYAQPERDSHDTSDRTIPTITYTVEFPNMVKYTPVYLQITYIGDDESNPIIKKLNESFPPRTSTWNDVILASPEAMEPIDLPERNFRVNSDYSISLVMEE